MQKTFWVASEHWCKSFQDALENEGVASVEACNAEEAVLKHAEELDEAEGDVYVGELEYWACPENRPEEAQTFIVTAELKPHYSASEVKVLGGLVLSGGFVFSAGRKDGENANT